MPLASNIRVVVRLPYNRPEQPLNDPPRIEWNAEKANMLWEVIARSRATESGGTDWKGLAAHLEVPLPYLLYRAQTRYEEDLRGLQDIRGALSPSSTHAMSKTSEEAPNELKRPSSTRRPSNYMTSSTARLSSSTLLATPLGVRARLNSLGNSPRPKKALSSSVITLQGPRKTHIPLRPTTPSSSEGDADSADEQAVREEEADRHLEEQEALDKKLKDLQKMMTNDALGLVSTSSPKGQGKQADRGRGGVVSPSNSQVAYRADELSSRSQSVSSASSPQGSIPSIPSPPPDAQRHSPISKHFLPGKSTSPPAVSPRSARGQSHLRYGGMVRTASVSASDQGSNQGSSASSFSDISEASLSASALESALLSNIRGTGSRFSAFARSRFSGRSAGGGGVNL